MVQAAEILGLSGGEMRQRLKRGTLPSEKDADSSVYVLLGRTDTDNTNAVTGNQALSDLVEVLKDQAQFLRDELDAEREANRENRRLLAAALERIPER